MHSHTLTRSSIIGLSLLLSACMTSGGGTQVGSSASSASSEMSQESSAMSESPVDIQVTAPHFNEAVSSPLTVAGQARGTWYFEASFPVRLLDGNGVELAVVPAQAQSDWMTTEMVPFLATLTFQTPTTSTGTLILKNDNPSGDPARDVQIGIPVRF